MPAEENKAIVRRLWEAIARWQLLSAFFASTPDRSETDEDQTAPGGGARRQARLCDDLTKSPLTAIIALLAGIVLLLFLWRVRSILLIAFAGITLAAALSPLISFLERWRLPRKLAIGLAFIAIFLVLPTALGGLLAAPFLAQIGQLASMLPTYTQNFQRLFQGVEETLRPSGIQVSLDQITRTLGSTASQAAESWFIAPLVMGRAMSIHSYGWRPVRLGRRHPRRPTDCRAGRAHRVLHHSRTSEKGEDGELIGADGHRSLSERRAAQDSHPQQLAKQLLVRDAHGRVELDELPLPTLAGRPSSHRVR